MIKTCKYTYFSQLQATKMVASKLVSVYQQIEELALLKNFLGRNK